MRKIFTSLGKRRKRLSKQQLQQIKAAVESISTTKSIVSESVSSLQSITEPYSDLSLECDGLSKVLAYVLHKNKIKYTHYRGELVDKKTGKTIYHEWIESGGFIIDYRARMWMGQQAPHGVFKYQESMPIAYEKVGYYTKPISELVFTILTM